MSEQLESAHAALEKLPWRVISQPAAVASDWRHLQLLPSCTRVTSSKRLSEARRRAAASWESMLLLKTPKSFHIPQRALASARKLTFISEQYELSIRLPLLFLLLLPS